MEKKRSLIFKVLFFLSLALNIGLGIFAFRTMDSNSKELPAILDEKNKLADENKMLKSNYSTAAMARLDEFKMMPNDTDEIIFFGNSLTANFLVSELFHDMRIRNRGINGEGINGLIKRLDEITEGKPKKIFIEIGINDILNSHPLDSIKQNYFRLVQDIRSASPQTTIYIQSLFPTSMHIVGKKELAIDNVKLLNDYLKRLADDKQVKYIDLFDAFREGNALNSKYDCGDNLHLNGSGYLLWRDLIKKYVEE